MVKIVLVIAITTTKVTKIIYNNDQSNNNNGNSTNNLKFWIPLDNAFYIMLELILFSLNPKVMAF